MHCRIYDADLGLTEVSPSDASPAHRTLEVTVAEHDSKLEVVVRGHERLRLFKRLVRAHLLDIAGRGRYVLDEDRGRGQLQGFVLVLRIRSGLASPGRICWESDDVIEPDDAVLPVRLDAVLRALCLGEDKPDVTWPTR